MTQAPLHPLDQAVSLEPAGDHRFLGHTSHAYWNMIGPFGGATAAVMLQAALNHPERLGDPSALTVNFAGPIAEGAFEIVARPSRTNRSTQHWHLELLQNGEITTTGSAVFAVRRETWNSGEARMPAVPAADTLPRMSAFAPVKWIGSYDMRAVRGAKPNVAAGTENPDSPVSYTHLRAHETS